MSAFKYQWNQTIDVGTAGLLSKQWTSIRHILSLLVTANACVHVTAYVAVRRSLSTTYTAVVLGLLLRQYVSYQFGVWAVSAHIALKSHCLLVIFRWSWPVRKAASATYTGAGLSCLLTFDAGPIQVKLWWVYWRTCNCIGANFRSDRA